MNKIKQLLKRATTVMLLITLISIMYLMFLVGFTIHLTINVGDDKGGVGSQGTGSSKGIVPNKKEIPTTKGKTLPVKDANVTRLKTIKVYANRMPKHLRLAEAGGSTWKTIKSAHQGVTYGYGLDLKASPDLCVPALRYAGVSESRLVKLRKGIGKVSRSEIEKAGVYTYILKRQKLERLIALYTKNDLGDYKKRHQDILLNLIYKGDVRKRKVSPIQVDNLHYWVWYSLVKNNLEVLELFLKVSDSTDAKRVKLRLKRSGLIDKDL